MNFKKFVSVLMCLCLMAGALTTVSYAAPTDGLCPHHTAHDASCGYVAAQAEVPCGHVCSVELGCTAATAEQPCTDVHTHDASCGYADAVAAVCVHAHDGTCGYADAVAPICVHTHDGACGYSADIPGTPCNHTCDIDEGCQYMGYCTHVHDAYCNYTEGTSGTPCTHVCAVETGCTLAAPAQPCTHVCAVETGCTLAAAAQPCTYVHTHNELCGYAPAQAASCGHTAHDSACGYSAAVAEIPCTFASTCADCDPFNDAVVTVASAGSYDGTAKTPAVTVTINGTALVENTDYTLSYSNNINAGTAVVTVNGINTYSGHQTAETFTIAPALLDVVADSFSKVYGEADPAFTYTVTGLVGSDTAASVLTGSLVRSPGENAGDYRIYGGSLTIVSGVSNYKIKSFTQGKLSITPKPVTITANDQSIVYGEALNKTALTADSLLSGHSIHSATLTPSTTDVTTSGTITPSAAIITDGTYNLSKNYEISYVNGNLSIAAKEVTPTITLTPDRYSYSGQPCTPTVKLMDGSAVIPASEYTVTYTNNVNIGTGTASVTDKDGGNYIIKPVSAPFSIVQQQAYAIISGNGQAYSSMNYYGLSFTTNAPAANLTGVFVDNQPVSTAYYTVAPYTNPLYPGVSGSTITLGTNLMNLVSNGTHTVIFKYSDGMASGTFIKGAASINGVKTGDDSNIGLLCALMCLGLMGSASILPAFRRQKNR